VYDRRGLSTGDLLERLEREGIEVSLSPREGYIIVRPEWVLTDAVEEAIVEHKPAIIKILKENITYRITGVTSEASANFG
jgi:hypothetical protein